MKITNNMLLKGALLGCLSFGASAKHLAVGYDSVSTTFDPYERLIGPVSQMSTMLFDPLVRFDTNMNLELRLAESWTEIDESTVQISLRQDVYFHSGNQFTADDVIWTFNRIQTSPDHKGIFSYIPSMEKIDDYTIKLKTNVDPPFVLKTLTHFFPMDKDFYSGVTPNGRGKSELVRNGESYASRHVSGTGPYVVKLHKPKVITTFVRNSNYWDKNSGNINSVSFYTIKNSARRVQALISGKADVISAVPPDKHGILDGFKDTKIHSEEGARLISFLISQKPHSHPALRDPRVRKAISYAINNEHITEHLMQGYATPASQQSPQTLSGHNESLDIRFDQNKAKSLLEEAGYGDGLSLTMMAPNNRYINDDNIALIAATMLEEVGIRINLETMPSSKYWGKIDSCEADLMMLGWYPDTEDSINYTEAMNVLRDEKTGKGAYNCGYSNNEVAKLAEAASAERDDDKRKSLLQTIEKLLYEDAAFIPIHWENPIWAARDHLRIEDITNSMGQAYFGDLIIN